MKQTCRYLLVVLAMAVFTASASAASITPDGSWTLFAIYNADTPASVVFTLDLTGVSGPQEVRIEDAFVSGDTYNVSVSNGSNYSTSSVTNDFANEISQMDYIPYTGDLTPYALDAWADAQSATPHFSAVWFLLDAGASYTITITRGQMARSTATTFSDVSSAGFISAGEPLPEPGTLAMLGLGIGTLVLAARRRL